jgi:hypothetical protein
VNDDPFEALGLPARPDLTDEEVRAAWRSAASATHPDRPDGGDPARYSRASAAYAELRAPWGRSEAYADLAEQAPSRDGTALDDPGPDDTGPDDLGADDTAPLPAVPGPDGPAPESAYRLVRGAEAALRWLAWLPARIRHGRPARLLTRAAVAVALGLAAQALIGGRLSAAADIGLLIGWLAVTGRRDLAPPPER